MTSYFSTYLFVWGPMLKVSKVVPLASDTLSQPSPAIPICNDSNFILHIRCLIRNSTSYFFFK